MKKKIVDIIFIIIAMVLCVAVRSQVLECEGVKNKYKEYFYNENEVLYMSDMDTYYYLRRTDEFINKDKYLLKPFFKDQYRVIEPDYNQFLPVLAGYIYKIVGKFGISVYDFIFYISPILFSFSVIPIYIFLKRKTNRLAAFVGAVFIGLSVPYYSNTTFGVFDTDVLLCLLPLIYMCSSISLLTTNKPKKYMIISTISYICLSFAWSQAPIYFYILGGSIFLLFIINLIKNKFNLKETINLKEVKRGLVLVLICLLITILVNLKQCIFIIESILNILRIIPSVINDYPDPAKYVGEMKWVPLFGSKIFDITSFGIVNYLGGILIVIIVLFAAVLILYKYFRKDTKKEFYLDTFIILIWFLGGLIGLLGGYRFLKILVLPFGILLGYGIYFIYNYYSKKNRSITITFLILVLVVLPNISVYKLANQITPVIDDSLEELTTYIKDNTSSDAILISWWDLGYYYEYSTERTCLLDGGTYDGRIYYLLTNALVTENSDLSKNLLVMLVGSYDKGIDLLEKYTNDTKTATSLLINTLSLDKEKGLEYLKDNLSLNDKKVEELIGLLYPKVDREIDIIVTQDMPKMKIVYSYYANYDFDKKEDLIKNVSDNAMIMNLDNVEYKDKNFELLISIEDKAETYSSKLWKLNY